MHAALICVICDRFIVGTEKFHWLAKKTILEHKDRLKVGSCEASHNDLKEQYAISDLHA